MNDISKAKRLIRDYYAALELAEGDRINDTIASYAAPGYLWRGFHPFDEISDARGVGDRFWQPLRRAFARMQRRQDIFFAGRNSLAGDGAVWVVSMGHLMGLFDEPWLGIPPTRKMAFLRYCEFNRVEDGRITETAMYFDIPHLMMQAGLTPFPPQTAAHLVQPGPATHVGLLYDNQAGDEGERTLALINRMISDLGRWNS